MLIKIILILGVNGLLAFSLPGKPGLRLQASNRIGQEAIAVPLLRRARGRPGRRSVSP